MKHCKFKKSNVHSRRRFSWCNLPEKIIFKISKKLETRDDILRFQQVCSKWRKHSVTPPAKVLLLNITAQLTVRNNHNALPFYNSKSPLVLRVSNIYLVTPSRDYNKDQTSTAWMIMAEKLNSENITVRHPLTAKKVKNFLPFSDMNQFKVLTLAQGFNFKSSNRVLKVVFSSLNPPSLEVMVLYHNGVLGKLSLEVQESTSMSNNDDDEEEEDGECFYSWKNFKVRHGGAYLFMYLDDVVWFRDMNCGVDRNGKLYVLDAASMSMSNSVVLVSNPICQGNIPSCRRKRLAVDVESEELYLVVRVAQKVRFKVYKLDEVGKRWDVVENIGHERVLFVGIDRCFFAMSKHFPQCDGNSIVFAARSFTQYNGSDAPDNSLFDNEGTEVGVYRLGEGDNFQLLSSACPEFAGIIWPPPTWFCTRECKEETEDGDATHQSAEVGNSSLRCLPDDHAEGLSGSSSGETECNDDNDNEMQTDSPDRDEEMESNSDVQEQTSEEHSGAQEQTSERNSDALEHETEKHSNAREQLVNEHSALPLLGFEEETRFRVTSDGQTRKHSFTDCLMQAPEKSSTVKSQGVDIRSELLPTLQTIWAKHGNLFTKDTIHCKKMLGCAMVELAELIITLKNTTARALTDSKVDEMKSALSDIQRAGLKVQWLEPVIENAIAIQKSKPFIESIAAVDKKKAKIEQEEREFLSRAAKVKQQLDEDRACLSTRIPLPADQIIDLDDNLGDGL